MLLSGPARERIGAGALLLFGIVAAAQSYSFGLGSLRSIGPGFFPFMLSLVIAGLSLVTFAKAAAAKAQPDEEFSVRAPLTIALAIVGFALALHPLGLVGAIVVSVFLSLFSLPRFSFRSAVLLSIALAAVCVAIFDWGLNLPISAFGSLGSFP